MHKLLAFLAFTLLATGCASAQPDPQNVWNPDPDSYRYAVYQKEGDEWQRSTLTNDPDARCPYDEPWREPVTAIRIDDRETGDAKTIDCEGRN